MKRNNDYILRTVVGDSFLVPVGKASERLNGMIHLTETAAWIWEHFEECKDRAELAEKLMDEYEIDTATAKRDVDGFVHELYIRGIVLEE